MESQPLVPAAPSEDEAYPPMRRGVVMCGLLSLATIVSSLDQRILFLLVEPIKASLGLSDFQISLLQGLAFAVLFVTAGLFLGYLGDTVSRRNLAAACLTIWSSATVACGLATNFVQMFAARVFIGAGEAGLYPAATSLMCDYFPPRYRGRAFGVFGQAGALGGAVASLGGAAIYGWITNHRAEFGAPWNAFAPWQLTFIAAGIPGLLLALAFLMVKEPPRRRSTADELAQGSILQFLWTRKPVLGWLFFHFALYQMTVSASIGWVAAYYMRKFSVTVFEAGMMTGVIIAVGSLGSLATGFLGDRWIQRRALGGRLRASVLSLVLAVPGLLLWFFIPTLPISMVGGALAYASMTVTLTAGPLTVADITPQKYRGRMAAIYLGVNSMFGVIFGPMIVASLTDFVFHDESKVNYSVAITTVSAVIVSTLIALGVMRRYSAVLYGRLPQTPN